MFKKLIVSISCIAILATIYTPIALATDTSAQKIASMSVSERKEQTSWKFKMIDGKLHKRLWSITWCEWLTEWTIC